MKPLELVAWFYANKGTLTALFVGLVGSVSILLSSLAAILDLLVKSFPKLKAADDKLHWAINWMDVLSKNSFLNSLAFNPKAAAKVLLAVLLFAIMERPAMASGLDWATGPTIPFLEFDPGNAHPLSIAPGAGLQLSLTHDALKKAIFGKSWDIMDLDLMAFGSLVSTAGGEQFGALSAAAAICTMSSLLCIGGGKHLFTADQTLIKTGWFMLLAFSFNFAMSPTAPPTGIAAGPAGMVRGNTIYFGAP